MEILVPFLANSISECVQDRPCAESPLYNTVLLYWHLPAAPYWVHIFTDRRLLG